MSRRPGAAAPAGDYGAMDVEIESAPPKQYKSKCMRFSEWVRRRVAGCLRCCCGRDEQLSSFVTGDDLDTLDPEYLGKEGSPLWTYFSFQGILTRFWWMAALLQALPMAYAAYAGLWMIRSKHEADDAAAASDSDHDFGGGMYVLFIGAWSGDSYLKWIWYCVNCMTMALAVFLPIQIRRLADWQETHPSIRHLLRSGRVHVKLSDSGADIYERRRNLESILREAESRPLCKATVEDGIRRGEVLVDVDKQTLDYFNALTGRLGSNVARAEVLTVDQSSHLEQMLELRDSGRAQVQVELRATLEESLGVTLNDDLKVKRVDPSGPASRATRIASESDGPSPLPKGCRLYKLIYVQQRTKEKAGIMVTTKRTAEHAFAEICGDPSARLVEADFVGLGDYMCCGCGVKKEKCRELRLVLQQLANVVLFVVLTLAAAAGVRYLTREKKVEKHVNTLILVSLALVLTKAVFEKVSGLLGGSAFGHSPETRETAALVQRLWFKVIILLVTLWMLAPQTGRCPENVLAGTLLVYMLIDYGVGWLIQFVMPILLNFLKFCCKKQGDEAGTSERAAMELHEEYLDVIYNQFVLYLTVPLFPGAAFLGLIFNIIEGRIDRWKIQSRFVREPEEKDSDVTVQINSVQTCLSALVFLAAVAPRVGIMFILNGNAVKEGTSGTCFFPDWKDVDVVSTNSSFFSFQWIPGMGGLEDDIAGLWHGG